MKPVLADMGTFSQFGVDVSEAIFNTSIEGVFKFILRSKLGSVADDVYSLAVDNDTRPQLKSLFDDYLKQYWTLLAIDRLIITHGIQITQYGIVIMTDPQGTFVPATAQERALVLQSVKQDLLGAETLLLNRLNEIKWVLDDVSYRKIGVKGACAPPSTSGSYGGISAID